MRIVSHRVRSPHLASTCLVAFVATLTAVEAAPRRAAPDEQPLPEVVVTAKKAEAPAPAAGASTLSAFTLTGEPLAAAVPATTDTARLMTAIPGVTAATGGGVSSLPVMRGVADDRINVLTMGMAITAACANHMNPPLSYADPSTIGSVEVLAGVTPVSKGGDSIGGSIIVERKSPVFATGDGIEVHGSAGATYRSNGRAISGFVTASVANRDWSLVYSGAASRAENYRAGGGAVVHSSLYEAQNHTITLARRLENGTFTVSGGIQDIPYQGFPNVRMDMLGNRGTYLNARFENTFDWGRLDARAYWQQTSHYMNFLSDKMISTHRDATKKTGMPMYTDGRDAGWSVKTEIDLGPRDLLRIGNELQHTTLDDWWPPVGSMVGMMCCSTFQNIRDGRRDRLGTYVEWERKWSPEWSTLLGIRNDTVWMDTGDVHGYSAMYATDAAAFNAQAHDKTDVNLDLTALVRWTPSETISTELGYARKTRSPNFYERYAWSTGNMAASMISWSGDGNYYVGNLALKPEVANTVSATLALHDAAKETWELKATPWYSYVENYIDADRWGSTVTGGHTFAKLKFANHDAALWGVDASAKTKLWASETWGRFGLTVSASYTHGENLDTHDGLYRVMPFETRIGLDHALGGWTSALEARLVAAKTDVSATRSELKTAGYGLLDWRAGYTWRALRVGVGVENILDKRYALPLGGVDWADYRTGATSTIGGVPGPGRTVWASFAVSF